jgi:hypothetical protein
MKNYLSMKFIGQLFFSLILFLNGMVSADVGGTLIPFYIYPTPTMIQPLLDAKLAHPNVAMRVILDPANGPGTTQDPVYVDAIASLRQAGIQVVGYVYTNNNNRSITDVMADIAEWQSLYNPDGIFLDSMGTDTNYYTSLTIYIKNLGMQFSIGNAGGNVSTTYTNAVDTVVIDTNSGLPNLTTYANWQNANLPKTDAAMLIYGVTAFPTGFIYEAKKFVGWIYITDAGGTDPWGVLPSYFGTLLNALDTVNVGTIFPFYIYPSSQAVIQPLIDAANQYPNVPIWVILNPATGPGTRIDQNYVNAVTQLRAVGINILGYVNTNYSHRSKTLVESDIQKWINFYQPDGIFLDLMSVNHTYYSSITAYAKGLGIQMVEANPGTNINQSAGNDVDIVNIFENNFLPSPLTQFSNWYNIYPPSKLSIICYNISPLPTSFITQAAQYFGWIFVTDNNDADPYDAYPTYFNSFIQLLSTL